VYLNQAALGLIGQPALEAMHGFLDEVAQHGNRFMSDDDELAYAYYSANIALLPETKDYDRRECADKYLGCTMQLYEFKHVRAAAHMILSAVDLNPRSWLSRLGIWLGWKILRRRVRHFQRLAAARNSPTSA